MEYRGMKDVLDFFTSRERIFKFFDNRHWLDWLPDETYLKLAFRAAMGHPLDLKAPKTFSEKLQWLKLYDRDPLYTTLVDKYAVRKYVADKIGEEHLIPLVGGPWYSAGEIDFDSLPEQFVLKCNHNSGGVIICRDKSSFDIEGAKARLNKFLARNYFYSSREWPYKNVKPCIIAEKYMDDGSDDRNGGLRDYKFYCFGGEVKFVLITTDRAAKDRPTRYNYFDREFNALPFSKSGPRYEGIIDRPNRYEEMLEIAQGLAEGLPQVRVDMYLVKDRIYFGELTFFAAGGMARFDPPEWDERIGSWLELPERGGK